MNACGVLLAAPASRSIRRLSSSGSLRLGAAMQDAPHVVGSQKVRPSHIEVKVERVMGIEPTRDALPCMAHGVATLCRGLDQVAFSGCPAAEVRRTDGRTHG